MANSRVWLIDDPNFARFWQAYPKKRAKIDAQKAWHHLKPTQELADRILGAVTWQKQTDEWLRDGGQYIPFPATWLRGMRWDDEPVNVTRLSERTMNMARSTEEFCRD